MEPTAVLGIAILVIVGLLGLGGIGALLGSMFLD